jgi:hypothetical protein
VVILAHGLNLRPGRLAHIRDALTSAGAVIGMLVLPGHDDGASRRRRRAELRAATAGVLRTLGRGAIEEAAALAGRRGLPAPRIVAVSLGALVLLEAAAGDRRLAEKLGDGLLLSPALALRVGVRALARVTSALPGALPVPSRSLPEDRVQRALPLAAYQSLFELLRSFENAVSERPLGLPLRVYADPADELVSVPGLRRLAEEGKLPRARLVSPPVGEPRAGRAHLLVDEETMGRTLWRDFVASTRHDGDDGEEPGGRR